MHVEMIYLELLPDIPGANELIQSASYWYNKGQYETLIFTAQNDQGKIYQIFTLKKWMSYGVCLEYSAGA